MSSTFKSALSLCGLSQQQAATVLNVRPDTIQSWCQGRRTPPETIWLELASLYARIEEAAEHAAKVLEVDGLDPRAYNNLEADHIIPLPEGSDRAAGAMALMILLQSRLIEG